MHFFPKAMSEQGDVRCWEIVFEGVTEPPTMAQALENSLFFQRCVAPKSVEVANGSVVILFISRLSRQEIVKKCIQTFPKCGSFAKYRVADKGPTSSNSGRQAGSEQPPGPAHSAPAPETTLARRSGVEDIKQLAAGLSPAECHSLAVFFGLKYLHHAQVSTVGVTATILAQKRAAAHVFAEAPATEWRRLLTKYSAKAAPPQGAKCDCRCGCGEFSGSVEMCGSCHRMCCLHCRPANVAGAYAANAALQPYFIRSNFAPDGWAPVCHHCTRAPKYTALPLKPPHPMDGLMWYFGAPYEEPATCFDRRERPCRWCNPNRDTKLDPVLLDITEVYKEERLENTTRHVRLPGWETAFTVQAVLGGKDGSQETVCINLFAFVMNQGWRAHSVVKYIKDDWLAQPQNQEKIGPVLHPHPLPDVVPSPPSPPSPWRLDDSTVSIEEVPDSGRDDEMAAMRAEVRRREAELPESDEDNESDFEEIIQAVKRRCRRDSSELLAFLHDASGHAAQPSSASS